MIAMHLIPLLIMFSIAILVIVLVLLAVLFPPMRHIFRDCRFQHPSGKLPGIHNERYAPMLHFFLHNDPSLR